MSEQDGTLPIENGLRLYYHILGEWPKDAIGPLRGPKHPNSRFLPPSLPVFGVEKGGRGDERGYLSALEPRNWEGITRGIGSLISSPYGD